jgi:hypothetical protein
MEVSKLKKRIALLTALSLIIGSSFSVSAPGQAATVKLNKTKATIKVGKTVKLKVKGTKKKVKWSSSKKAVATVSAKGVVKGKKAGKTIITAKVSKKKYTCKLTVKKAKAKVKVTAAPVTTKKPATDTSVSIKSITSEYEDAVVMQGSFLTNETILKQLGKITIHYSDGRTEEYGDDLASYFHISDLDTAVNADVVGEYTPTLAYRPADLGDATMKIKLSVAAKAVYDDFIYASNGKIAKVYAYTGDKKDIVIPNSIYGADVISAELEYGVYKLNADGEEVEDNLAYEITSITLPKCQRYGVSFDGYIISLDDYDDDDDEDSSGVRKEGFAGIEAIYVDKDNAVLSSEDGVLFNKDKTRLIAYPRNKKTENYVIPNTVRQILGCYHAFYNTGQYLKSVTIPASVQEIGNYEFVGGSIDTALEKIIVDDNNKYFKSIDGVLFEKEGQGLLYYPAGKKDKKYTIPDGVSYAKALLACNPYVETLVIPETVKEIIGDYSFGGCLNLKNIYIDKKANAALLEDETYYEGVLRECILEDVTIYVRSEKMRQYILSYYADPSDVSCVISTNYDW